MEKDSLSDENWQVISNLLPKNWRELGKKSGAISRKLRSFDSIDSVMRTLLLHIAQGYSLRETAARAKIAGISTVSDVGLLQRLRYSETWLKMLCAELFQESGLSTEGATHGITMRAVDGSCVKEPGKTGSQWRIHYSLNVVDLCCDHFELTPMKGKGNGEKFTRFPVRANDCILGDRAYSSHQGIHFLAQQKAYSLVRVNTGNLVLHTHDNEPFNLLACVNTLSRFGRQGEWPVRVNSPEGDEGVSGRICIIKKSKYSANKAITLLKREAAKKKRTIRKETLVYAKYVIVFTTLPEDTFSTEDVLKWYRVRWQIELAFKRLKSLAGLGHLPKYDECSSRAWLYGKLLVGLLTEKLMRVSAFSPWGYESDWD